MSSKTIVSKVKQNRIKLKDRFVEDIIKFIDKFEDKNKCKVYFNYEIEIK